MSSFAHIIKEIGRGKQHARDMDTGQARALFDAMLGDEVPGLELGGILIALRIKGEAPEEMLGFYQSMQAGAVRLTPPPGGRLPVVIPSYNGARKQANLTPLLALMLCRAGLPVLVHGVSSDPGRVTSAEIFARMGIPPSAPDGLRWEAGLPVFMPVEQLAPEMARLLALRWRMGVRNSAHTLIKLLDPFAGDSVRITSVSHPDYISRMASLFNHTGATALLLNGTEGEPYANPLRCPPMHLCRQGELNTLVEREAGKDCTPEALAAAKDAETTALWIQDCLDGRAAIPYNLRLQAAACLVAAGEVRTLEQGLDYLA